MDKVSEVAAAHAWCWDEREPRPDVGRLYSSYHQAATVQKRTWPKARQQCDWTLSTLSGPHLSLPFSPSVFRYI